MSSENVAAVEALLDALPTDFVAAYAAEGLPAPAREALAQLADPDFEFVMAGPDPAFRQTATGVAGFTDSWSDWLGTFESFRIEPEETIDAGEHVVSLARLSGRTRTGGVEMEQPAAAVFKFGGAKITRIEFHLDRDLAYKSAGLEPESETQSSHE
jgi:ketosteroid isomerase-like protein